jgi:hypothetical protein
MLSTDLGEGGGVDNGSGKSADALSQGRDDVELWTYAREGPRPGLLGGSSESTKDGTALLFCRL